MADKTFSRLGQNFLISPAVIERIISAIVIKKNDNLLEIGPGRGAITLPILEKVGKLYAVEIDKNLSALLKSFKKNNLVIYECDILKFDLSILPMPLRIIGNLPYNISSAILFYLLEHINKIKDMTFMLQKEIAMRIIAQNNNKIYGRLSVMLQAFFKIEMLFIVPAKSFTPVPKVSSAILYFQPLTTILVVNYIVFAKIVKTAFSHRRKILKNCLKSLLTQKQTQIDLSQRAENLSVNDFIVLTNDFQKSIKNG